MTRAPHYATMATPPKCYHNNTPRALLLEWRTKTTKWTNSQGFCHGRKIYRCAHNISTEKFVNYKLLSRKLNKVTTTQEQLENDHKEYMLAHPELRAILADFLQSLLIHKPDDVYQFARDTFTPFAAMNHNNKTVTHQEYTNENNWMYYIIMYDWVNFLV